MIIEVGRSCIVMNRINRFAILASSQNIDNQKLTPGGEGYLTSRFFWNKCVTIRAG